MGKIRALQSKKERQTTGMTLVEGERLVGDTLREGVNLESVVATAEVWARRVDLVHACATAGIQTLVATPKQFDFLATTDHPSGMLAVAACPVWREEQIWAKAQGETFFGTLLVALQDPGNFGTLVRTLAAAGGSGMWVSEGNTESASPKAVRASAGAVFHLPVVSEADPLRVIKRCRERGVQCLAAAPRQGRPHTSLDLTKPSLLVLGGEGGGLPTEVIGACDQRVQIPMPGEVESLNVATAGAILMFEGVRQRRLAQGADRRNKS
ncbi:MAG: RNA methyltransferase [candidate division FCPU426 bacterium]